MAVVLACASSAQSDEAAQRAMIAKYAGSYNTGSFLIEPSVRVELQKLLGRELVHLGTKVGGMPDSQLPVNQKVGRIKRKETLG